MQRSLLAPQEYNKNLKRLGGSVVYVDEICLMKDALYTMNKSKGYKFLAYPVQLSNVNVYLKFYSLYV